jgi:hypothetical protein
VPIPEAEIEPLPLKAAEPVAVQRVAAAPVAVMAPPVQNVQAVAVRVEAPRRGSGLGLAACILGVLAFVICWVPLIGLIGVPLSALGLILGLIGLLVAILRKGAGIGFAIAGSAICGLALVVAITSTVATGKAIQAGAQSMVDARKEAERTNQQVIPVAPAPVRPANRPVQPAPGQPAPQGGQSQVKPPAAPAPKQPEEAWASAADTVKQGDVTVRITSAFSGKVPLKGGFGDTESKSADSLLAIEVEIGNAGKNKKIEYHTFMGRSFAIGRDYASLHDNFDNVYKRIDFGMSKPIGANESESIYPGKSITDVLCFELPIDTAEYLNLELPAQSFGGTGMLRIRIPAKMIQPR